jgi:hypothetical protein
MNEIYWQNSTLSGLGDRLLDIFLLLSSLEEEDILYLDWKENKNINEFQKKVWPSHRMEDYLYENLSLYFEMPKNLIVLGEGEKKVYKNTFHDYLGGIYTPKSFHEKYVRDKTYTEYKKNFDKLISNFKPKKKLLDIMPSTFPDIAIHLRRTDNIVDINDQNDIIKNIKPTSLPDLERNTTKVVNYLCSKMNYKNIFICSDDEESLEKFSMQFQNFNIISSKNKIGIEKTYFDFYMMMISKHIILSNYHSNFSLFASQVNKSNLIHFYKSNQILTFGGYENCTLYEVDDNEFRN